MKKGVRFSLAAAFLAVEVSGQNAADDPICLEYTGSYNSVSISDIQGSYTMQTTEGNCFPSQYDGEYVAVSGTVSAVGATKNSYTAGYFYLQDCEDNAACAPFSAIEVFHDDHADSIAVNDVVEVRGYVSEEDGNTLLVACTYSKIGTSSIPISPIEITTSDLPLPYHPDNNADGTACTESAEGYEHMLVKILNPVVQCCSDAHGYVDGTSYEDRCQGNIDVSWDSVWDVYKQFYVTTAGETNSLVDIDNHFYSTFTKYYTRCEDSANDADQFDSITGIVGWWEGTSSDSARWDVAPRDEFDIVGADPIDTSQVQTRTISEVKNAISPGIIFGNDFDAIPPELLGTNEVNSDGIQGTGCDGAGGTGRFTTGSCPSTDVRGLCEFYPQSICNCYPLNTYSSVSAHGSEYMFVEGIVNHVQDPTGPFYFEDGCGIGNGIYVYRNDADQALSVGDKVRVLGRAFHYYGLDELTDPIEIAVISTNNPLCTPATITAAPFQDFGNGDCSIEAEVIEGAHVMMEDVTVTRIFNSLCLEEDAAAAGYEFADDWSSQWCPDSCPESRCWGAFLQGYFDNDLEEDFGFGDTYTAIEIADKDGNTMVLDQSRFDQTSTPLTPYYLGIVPGNEGQTLKVGDTFSYVSGFVDHRRGTYSFEYGGYYAFIVKEFGEWNPDPSQPSGSKKKSSGLDDGALIGVIVACVIVALVVGFCCLVVGAKYHRAVERNTQICKPTDDPQAKLELMPPGTATTTEEGKESAKLGKGSV